MKRKIIADVNIARATIEELKQQHKYMKDLMKLMKQKQSLAKAEFKRQKLSRKKGHISAQPDLKYGVPRFMVSPDLLF
ncbi:MAG: hypothetical protein OMM_13520 [Candidatus Magnetoglobus multicellularis str. Araruama]|uniref:Uncharacterized protein n=1 Tax=Candidatus Magnetoglobus multicellularis str. Araruama TaxID=890399 RepID=A0A1V1NTK9_9BACT|nr:MAG: hypothetical protein OMM_13520 [Candidatus Magnetoglobus multicellularis str. Araruama]